MSHNPVHLHLPACVAADDEQAASHLHTWHALVLPDCGGALAAFYSVGASATPQHWLRPAPVVAAASASVHAAGGAISPLDCASFALLPWSNRIKQGRFTFDGLTVQLHPSPYGLGPHSLHGLGWTASWDIVEQTADRVLLQWHYAGLTNKDGSVIGWPWPFRTIQEYRLYGKGLQIRVRVCNTGRRPMPAGVGHHPYFLRKPSQRAAHATITAQCHGWWATDAEQLPTHYVSQDALISRLAQGLAVNETALDTHFTGFNGQATIAWDDGCSLHMRSNAILQTLVLYTPQHKNFFCVEPVSHSVDGLNLRQHYPAAQIGGHVLAPGESLEAVLSLEPSQV